MKFFKQVGTWCEWVGAILLSLCTLITFSNVWLRYVLKSPLQWGEEVTILLLLGLVYITQYSNELTGNQLRLTVLSFKNKTINKILSLINSVITVAVLIILVKYGWQVVQLNTLMGIKTNVTQVPLWIFFGILSLSFLGMAVARAVYALSAFFENSPADDCINNESAVEKVEVY